MPVSAWPRLQPRARRVRAAAGAALRWAWAYARRSPGTFVWLAILLITTGILTHLTPQLRTRWILHRSTNLHELSHDPLRVLVSSALWIDGGHWWPYFALYNLFHVPAERWLGTRRWLAVAAIAHVGATYISQTIVYFEIRHGTAPPSAAFIPDIGVSYALAGVEGVLTFLIASPWRYPYIAGLAAYYGEALVDGHTFTDVGHFTALLLGLACYPLTVSRPGRWEPMDMVRWLKKAAVRRSSNP
ncbi:MAG TPA: rhomboid-like protein [Actinocrinis sp.]|nr:rhomboid-like protein [Actinocrinis sp.]